MLRFDPDQAARIVQLRFVQQLEAGMARCVPAFGALAPDLRLACLAESLDAASASGLRSEQGLAAYALAAAYLGPGFEQGSPALAALLAGSLPEARRIHALNAWAQAAVGAPENPAQADAALRLALLRSAPLAQAGH